VKEDLLETNYWNDYARYVEGYGLEAKLRTWQTKATNYFEVDISKLPAESRERLKTGLRAVIDNLVDEMNKAGVNYRDIVRVVDDEREDLEDELK
jgi:hypothetical protein